MTPLKCELNDRVNFEIVDQTVYAVTSWAATDAVDEVIEMGIGEQLAHTEVGLGLQLRRGDEETG